MEYLGHGIRIGLELTFLSARVFIWSFYKQVFGRYKPLQRRIIGRYRVLCRPQLYVVIIGIGINLYITTNSPTRCIELSKTYIYMFLYAIASKLFYHQCLHKHHNRHHKIIKVRTYYIEKHIPLILSYPYMR
jgi:hypothetical protein